MDHLVYYGLPICFRLALLLFSEEHYAACNECLTAVRYGFREALMVVEEAEEGPSVCLMCDAGSC